MGAWRCMARGAALRCPHCGRGRIWRTFLDAHDACPACGRRFAGDRGDWTGGAEITFLLVAGIAVGLIFAVNAWASLPAWADLLVLLGACAVLVPVVYRHVKGFWLGALRAWEGDPPAPPPKLREPEWFAALWDEETR